MGEPSAVAGVYQSSLANLDRIQSRIQV